ncbi:MAG TPA: hypothetical protein VFG67_04240, partial [Oleiagrimonas sp.]|nr:hypothetical protein [Oleiagrimonas sp.]
MRTQTWWQAFAGKPFNHTPACRAMAALRLRRKKLPVGAGLPAIINTSQFQAPIARRRAPTRGRPRQAWLQKIHEATRRVFETAVGHEDDVIAAA